ncbi:MAG: hypothetical protein ACRCW0_00840 [Clostridium sp.]
MEIIIIIICLLAFVGLGVYAYKSNYIKSKKYHKNICDSINIDDLSKRENIDIVHIYKDIKYVGGLGDIDPNILLICKDRIRLYYDDYNSEYIDIYKESIKSVKLESKLELKEKVNTGKLLIFGIFALGMKKDSLQEYSRFIRLDIYDNSVDIELYLYDKDNDSNIVRDIKNIIT